MAMLMSSRCPQHGGVPMPIPALMPSLFSRCPHRVGDAPRPRDSEGGQIPQPGVPGPGRATATGALEPSGLTAEGGAPDAAAHGQPGCAAGEWGTLGCCGHCDVPGAHHPSCPLASSHRPSRSTLGPTSARHKAPWARRKPVWTSVWRLHRGTPGPPRSLRRPVSPWWLGTPPHCTAQPQVWGGDGGLG